MARPQSWFLILFVFLHFFTRVFISTFHLWGPTTTIDEPSTSGSIITDYSDVFLMPTTGYNIFKTFMFSPFLAFTTFYNAIWFLLSASHSSSWHTYLYRTFVSTFLRFYFFHGYLIPPMFRVFFSSFALLLCGYPRRLCALPLRSFDPDFVATLLSSTLSPDASLFPIIFDTGCSFAVTPDVNDFVGPPVYENWGKIQTVSGLPMKMTALGIVRWTRLCDGPR